MATWEIFAMFTILLNKLTLGFLTRNMKEEIQTFRGHKKEASSVAWHPIHEGMFSSGGSDGSIIFWNVNQEKEIGVIEQVSRSFCIFLLM